jgi:hypothetical protein
MAKQEIEIVIDEDGTIHMEGINFHGKGCVEMLTRIQHQLGKLVSVKKKAEFYNERITVGQKTQVKG